jgi:hypothetical protein
MGAAGNLSEFVSRFVEVGEAPNDRGEPFEVDPAVQGNETWNKIRGEPFSERLLYAK